MEPGSVSTIRCALPSVAVPVVTNTRLLALWTANMWLFPGVKGWMADGPAAVDRQVLAGDVGCFIRCQEEGCRGDFLRPAEPVKHGHIAPPLQMGRILLIALDVGTTRV